MICFFDLMDVIVVIFQNYVDSSLLFQWFQEKVLVVFIGICDQVYFDSEWFFQKFELFVCFQLKGYFLFVGMLCYYKGLYFFFDVLVGLDIYCVVVGIGLEEQVLKQKVGQLGLGNFYFIGLVDDVIKCYYFENCKGVVFFFYFCFEVYGVILLEGVVYGKFLISCEIGIGISFVNIYNESGLVIFLEDLFVL